MKIIQRTNIGMETHDFLLSAAEKYHGAFTDVWLCVPSGFPKNEVHRKNADNMAALAQEYRKRGIKVAMQVANSIGHGSSTADRDYSGVVFDGSPVRRVTGHDGLVSEFCFCWNDEFHRAYLCEHLEYYAAKVRPAEMWFDDDLTNGRDDVRFGCFCEGCVAKFNAIYGTNYTPEELGHEFAYGDLDIRQKYVKFVEDGLGEFAEVLARAIHKGCPDTVVCLQNGARNYSIKPILDGMYRGCGHAPMYRAGVGVYRDHNPNLFFMKMQLVSLQHAGLPDYVVCRCPEIDNIPSNAFGKSMYGTALETTFHFAAGATGISHAFFSATYELHEDAEFYEQSFAMFSELRPYWDRLAKVNKKSISGGITALTPKRPYMKKLVEGDSIDKIGNVCYNEMPELLRNGIPIDFEGAKNGVYILHPNVAEQMEEWEIRELFAHNVITDTKTVLLLKNRGIDIGVDGYECTPRDCATFTETYSDHVTAVHIDRQVNCTYYYPRFYDHCNITALPDNAEVVSTFTFEDIKEPITNIDGAPYGCASAILNLPEGGKWAIVGYGLWKGNVPTFRRDFILNLIDYIGDKAPGARAVGPFQNYLMPRISSKTGKTFAVSYLNCTIGPQNNIPLIIRRPETENFRLMCQFGEEVPLEYTKNGDEYTVHIPTLPAWSVATVFCD